MSEMKTMEFKNPLFIGEQTCTSLLLIESATKHFSENEVMSILEKQNGKSLEPYRQNMEMDSLEYKTASQGSFFLSDGNRVENRDTSFRIEDHRIYLWHCGPRDSKWFAKLDQKYKR